MTILGIDQGIANIGYCIIRFDGANKELVEFGTLKTKPNKTLGERIIVIVDALTDKVNTHKPEIVACEKLFCNPPQKNGKRNKSAAIVNTNTATGLIHYVSAKGGAVFKDISPMSVKKLIANSGKASKDEVKSAIIKTFPELENTRTTEHAIDSIAIACAAYLQLQKTEKDKA